MRLVNATIRNCQDFGLLIQESRAEVLSPEITGCRGFGIAVSGNDDALQCIGGRIVDNDVGLLLTSGTAELSGVEIEDSDTGVLVSRQHLLHHEITGASPLRFTAKGGRIAARIRAVQFLSPGSCQLIDCQASDPDGVGVAASQDLERAQQGNIIEFLPKG
jgi:hypothetical protein